MFRAAWSSEKAQRGLKDAKLKYMSSHICEVI